MKTQTADINYGIYRTERRAKFFHCSAGFLRCPVSGSVLTFGSRSDACAFLASELAQSEGPDYKIMAV